MCCGAGTLALALAQRWPKSRIVGIDCNPRACDRAVFNKRLHEGLTNATFTCADLFEAETEEEPYDLIIAAPPFALQPPGWPEFAHSAGGPLGDRVLHRLIEQAPRFLKPDGGRFILLAYSLGTKDEPTRLNGLLRDAFPEVSWPSEPCRGGVIEKAGENVWRFGEQKCIPCNPMPVEYMVIRFGDPHYLLHKKTEAAEAEVRESVRQYVEWIENDLKSQGYDHLHYILVNLARGKPRARRGARRAQS
jgi:SAM-dependent methyltransferase